VSNKIYLTREGYEEYLKEIEDLKQEFNNKAKGGTEAAEAAVGDGWHDNFDFEEAKKFEYSLAYKLKEKINNLSNIEIIENTSNNSININDYIYLTLIYSEDDKEEIIVKLIGSPNPNLNAKYHEITLNSPLGRELLNKGKNYQGSYLANNQEINFIIHDYNKNVNELKINN
jgi:transcription elongation factor greA